VQNRGYLPHETQVGALGLGSRSEELFISSNTRKLA
jgi:hypothetical protein